MEFSQVKQNVEVPALSTQSPLPPPPPNSGANPHHQPPPPSFATACAHHQCTSSCVHHFPPNTTLTLATPNYQPPSPAATAPSAFTQQAAPSPTAAAPALPVDTPYHESSSSSAIAPTLAVSTPQPAPSSPTTSALCFSMPKYKSSLYILVEKLDISIPEFHTVCEGPSHAPRFQSRVWVDNTWFTSQNTFFKRKDAEEDVSKVAFEALQARLHAQPEVSKVKYDGRSLILEESRLSKSILYEYAVKMKVEMPTYQTSRQDGLHGRFVSSVVFNGVNYTGDANKNKKDAEQSAACAAILTILGGSTSGILYEILESKFIGFAAPRQDTSQQCIEAGTASVSRNHGDKEVVGPQVGYGSETDSEIPAPSHMPSSLGEFQMPEHESSIEASMPQNMSLQSGEEQSIGDGLTSRKRQRAVGLQVFYGSATNVELPPPSKMPYSGGA